MTPLIHFYCPTCDTELGRNIDWQDRSIDNTVVTTACCPDCGEAVTEVVT